MLGHPRRIVTDVEVVEGDPKSIYLNLRMVDSEREVLAGQAAPTAPGQPGSIKAR